MRALGASRTSVATGGILGANWARNPLWKNARAVPGLDLRFAENKSLTDAKTGASLVTFTRASTGTFVGSDGVLQSAVTNLLTYSEQFDNAAWTKGVGVSVAPNTTISPVGTLTADTVTADSGISILQNINSVVGTSYTNSAYVKAGTATSVMFRDDTGAGRHIVFNPSTGVITATSGTFVSTPVSQPLGDGWYRYLMTYVADTTSVRGLIRPNSAGSAQTFIAWGAQIEAASTVGEYIPTTSAINSAPRFDHNPTTGESLGLLVEEARTNLITTSEALANITGASILNNTTTAPDGLVTADTLIEDTSTGAHSVNTASIIWAGNTTYTFTIFLKANTRTQVNLAFGSASNWVNTQRSAQFDLSTGTILGTAGSSVTASIDSFANGWYRCRLTATTVAAPGPSTVQIQMYVSGSTSYTGNGTSGMFFWGAQLEANAFPTSYIPTTTATATRAADVASITGTAFSSWYRQDEGTFYADTNLLAGVTSTNRFVFEANDGVATTGDKWDLRRTGGSAYRTQVRDGGVSNSDQTISTSANPLRITVAADSSAVFTSANGTATSSAVKFPTGFPTVDRLFIGGGIDASTLQTNGTIKRLTYWPVRLANPTLVSITQP